MRLFTWADEVRMNSLELDIKTLQRRVVELDERVLDLYTKLWSLAEANECKYEQPIGSKFVKKETM